MNSSLSKSSRAFACQTFEHRRGCPCCSCSSSRSAPPRMLLTHSPLRKSGLSGAFSSVRVPSCGRHSGLINTTSTITTSALAADEDSNRPNIVMNPKTKMLEVAPADYEAPAARASRKKAEGDELYASIKQDLIKSTATQGGFLCLYLAVVLDLESTLSCGVGVAGAVAYVYLLEQYVDNLGKEGSWAPPTSEARSKALQAGGAGLGGVLSTIPSRFTDIYRQAIFQKRLLVPVVIAVLGFAANQLEILDFKFGFALLGFLTYKTATIAWVWNNDIKPDMVAYLAGEGDNKPIRPIVPDVEDPSSPKK